MVKEVVEVDMEEDMEEGHLEVVEVTAMVLEVIVSVTVGAVDRAMVTGEVRQVEVVASALVTLVVEDIQAQEEVMAEAMVQAEGIPQRESGNIV